VLTVGPLLVFAAIAITGSVMHNSLMDSITAYEPLGTIAAQLTRLAPYLLVIGAFTFFYVLIPNTRVRFSAAIAGGVTAGLLWETAGYIFAYFVATATKYQAVYATFGTAMFFMIWMYVSWLILLVGASVSYYVQHPRIVIARARKWRFNFESFEEVALAVIADIVTRYYAHEPPLNVERLSESRQVPPEMIDRILNALIDTHIVSPTSDLPPAYVLTVPPEETRVVDTLLALRRYQPPGSRRVDPREDSLIARLREKIDASLERVFADTTLKDFACDNGREDTKENPAAGSTALFDRA
jgi:membrane protein